MLRRASVALAVVIAGFAYPTEPSDGLRAARAEQAARATAAREGAAEVMLPDGRVLVTGGMDGHRPSDAVAIFNPADGSIRPLQGGLRRPRAWHTATVLPDGSVAIVGGVGVNGRVERTVEVIAPADGTVRAAAADALTGRARHSATLLTDGRILVAGGEATDGGIVGSAELWDPATGAVESIEPGLAAGRRGHTAELQADGSVLIRGGNAPVAGAPPDERFDPPARQFSAAAGAPDATAYLAGSIPEDGSARVAIDTTIALRFSRPLRADTIGAGSVTLVAWTTPVPVSIVVAEGGRLVFVRPGVPLQAGTEHVLTIDRAAARDGQLVAAVMRFTTADPARDAEAVEDDEGWVPDAHALRNDWRSGRADSPWRRLPPLKAPAGVTAVSGQVLLLNGRPLADATLQIGSKIARTDRTGRFLLADVAPGRHVLTLDGHSADRPKRTYGVFEVGVMLAAGQTHELPYTMWMPAIDTGHAVTIPSPTTSEVVVTTPHIPGLELRLPRGTVIRKRNGEIVREVSITPIPVDRPPFPLPGSVEVPVYFTIQPGGAELATGGGGAWPEGARLVYPNYRNVKPGSRIHFWQYDPEDRGWFVYGNGAVRPDGRQIEPGPGVSIYEFTGAMVSDPNYAPEEGPEPDEEKDKDEDGDPVDLSTGLFILQSDDLFMADTIPIQLTRTYRQRDTRSRAFGIGTTHVFDMFLVGTTNPWSSAELILPDGGRVRYTRISPGTNYSDAVFEHTSSPSRYHRSRIAWRGAGWELKLRDGTAYLFPDSEGASRPAQAALTGIRDRNGNAVTLARGPNGILTKVLSPNGRSFRLEYDSGDRITRVTDSIGRVVDYEYDGSGRLWKVTRPGRGVTEYSYDTGHRMLTIKDARGTVFLTNTYDANGRVETQTQADGGVFQFAYTTNAGGQVTATQVTDPRGMIRRVTYNAAGYQLTDTRAFGRPEQQVTTYERQAGTNFLTAEIDPLGRRTEYAYDPAGHLTTVTRLAGTASAATTTFTYEPLFHQIATIVDPLSRTTQFDYDSRGNVVTTTSAAGIGIHRDHDAAGRTISVTDPAGLTWRFFYEGGDLTSMIDPANNATTRRFDAAGRVVRVTDALGQGTSFVYDDADRRTEVQDAAGGSTTVAYDANGMPTRVTGPDGNWIDYTYNSMDRVASRTDPLTRETSYAYDLAGNLVLITDRKGQRTVFEYDGLNRLTLTGFGASAATPVTYESTIATTYDAAGRIVTINDSSSGVIARAYNGLDGLLEETTAAGTIGYTYDAGGRRTGMTAPGQDPVTYTFDADDRPLTIVQGPKSVGYTYDGTGRLTELTLPNGVRVTRSYDGASRVSSLSYYNGTTLLGDLQYAYDAAGRRSGVSGSLARTGLPAAETFTYDDGREQITVGAASLTYDANGNLIGDGVNTYTWNARDELVSVSGSVSATFAYDAFGRRTTRSAAGVTTSFVYDGVNAIQESAGSVVAGILNGPDPDEVLARTDPSGTLVYLRDMTGSVLGLVDPAGAVATSYTYEPFGSVAVTGAASASAAQFTGRENDGTGLFYYRARYYHPRFQRFISEDRSGLDRSPNPYAYVDNDPVNFTDPSGNILVRVYPDPTWIFWKNYRDMRQWKQSDKYFHCKANCEASRAGPLGESIAEALSELREWTDEHIKGDSRADCDADRRANEVGRKGKNSPKSCPDVCQQFRPPGLPKQY